MLFMKTYVWLWILFAIAVLTGSPVLIGFIGLCLGAGTLFGLLELLVELLNWPMRREMRQRQAAVKRPSL
jgi:hypothetical protein